MTMVFWGFFFALLNFNLTFGSISIPLLPDAAGFIVLFLFSRRRGYLNPYIAKTQNMWCVLSILSVMELAMGLTGIGFTGVIGAAWQLTCFIIFMVAGTNLLKGISIVASAQGIPQKGKQVSNAWMGVVVLGILTMLLSWIPVAGWVLLLADVVMNIVFLLLLYGLTSKMSL